MNLKNIIAIGGVAASVGVVGVGVVNHLGNESKSQMDSVTEAAAARAEIREACVNKVATTCADAGDKVGNCEIRELEKCHK